jgi:hypothetical protein
MVVFSTKRPVRCEAIFKPDPNGAVPARRTCSDQADPSERVEYVKAVSGYSRAALDVEQRLRRYINRSSCRSPEVGRMAVPWAMHAADAGVPKPSANRPAVPSRNFLMIRFPNLIKVYLLEHVSVVCLRVLSPNLRLEAYARGRWTPVPKWQDSRSGAVSSLDLPGAGFGAELQHQCRST